VTASVLKASNYGPVVEALNLICTAKDRGEQVGDVYLVACENTVSAQEVLAEESLCDAIKSETHKHTRCVHALVDRMCVGLEEYPGGEGPIMHPTVLVRAEEYGSLKLEIGPDTEGLPELCAGSRIEFSRYLDVEKKIKGWLLNGTHWLIALTAFQASDGNTDLKLNEYLVAHPERLQFAKQVIREISEGIAILLRKDPEYADFVRDVSPEKYLDGAAKAILRRFSSTEDSIARILARFRKPSPGETTTIESFVKRFFDRVDPPIAAYEAEKGIDPPATSHGLVSLCRLLASGTFVDSEAA
jgi:mannitol-1-phosphate/altronate dehydrogenase